MKRTTLSFGAAGLGALGLSIFMFAEASTAFAQEQATAVNAVAHTVSPAEPDEIVPIFVEKAVVQDVSAAPAVESAPTTTTAASLSELVAITKSGDILSEDIQCLAGAIYFEARGEPLSGQLAVAQVIVNRTESGQFPSDYCGVVYQRSQFSFVRGGAMPRIKTGSAAWKRAMAIAHIAHYGLWESEAGDSLYFHAKHVSPQWAHRKTARAKISTHVFYR